MEVQFYPFWLFQSKGKLPPTLVILAKHTHIRCPLKTAKMHHWPTLALFPLVLFVLLLLLCVP